ncbi:MAG TPA: DUF192 domain-containing protein [Steroidobacteraceae bacterium]|nr:DUF192 domain-containing protein [Steroidobacteraceae bacterium]
MNSTSFEHIAITAATLRTRPERARLILAESLRTLASVRIARSFWSRFFGLLGRRSLKELEGLLFVPGGSIHTMGMRFAIDVIFLDAQMTVLRVSANVRPWRCALAPRHTCSVLELAAHAAAMCGVEAGQAVTLQTE